MIFYKQKIPVKPGLSDYKLRKGLEPSTYALRVRRSTNWAIEARMRYYIRFFPLLQDLFFIFFTNLYKISVVKKILLQFHAKYL